LPEILFCAGGYLEEQTLNNCVLNKRKSILWEFEIIFTMFCPYTSQILNFQHHPNHYFLVTKIPKMLFYVLLCDLGERPFISPHPGDEIKKNIHYPLRRMRAYQD
jgi:hypothetical protein